MTDVEFVRVGLVSRPRNFVRPPDEPDDPEHMQDWSAAEPRRQPDAETPDGRILPTCPWCGQRMQGRSKVCADCRADRTLLAAGVQGEPVVVKKLRKRKRKPPPPPPTPAFVDFPPFHRYRATCPECGCLLAEAAEPCPACRARAWREEVAAANLHDVIPYAANLHNESRQAA